ncbi:MAG: prepilin-type N-terminal cleavage/methylation domain-containing protein [bacterium]
MTKSGFTLIEVLVVLAILGFFIAMMAKVFTKQDDQRRFDETRVMMKEIKKAILGQEGAYANGQRQFAGYVADMGGLPDLVDENGNVDPNGQPKGLWTRDLNGDGDTVDQVDISDSVIWQYKVTSKTWMGWRGPYIEAPPLRIGETSGQEKLRDGWGNPFIFGTTTPGDLIVSSPGANGVINAADTGFNEDITMTIKKTEYMAPVAGRVIDYSAPSNVTVIIYVPINGTETPFVIPTPPATDGIDAGGYFRFEQDNTGNANGKYEGDIPVGLRSIVIIDSGYGSSTQRVFTVEPTGNWLGDIEIE